MPGRLEDNFARRRPSIGRTRIFYRRTCHLQQQVYRSQFAPARPDTCAACEIVCYGDWHEEMYLRVQPYALHTYRKQSDTHRPSIEPGGVFESSSLPYDIESASTVTLIGFQDGSGAGAYSTVARGVTLVLQE